MSHVFLKASEKLGHDETQDQLVMAGTLAQLVSKSQIIKYSQSNMFPH